MLYLSSPAIRSTPKIIAMGFVIAAFQIYCQAAVDSLYENIKKNSTNGVVKNEPTVWFLMPKTEMV